MEAAVAWLGGQRAIGATRDGDAVFRTGTVHTDDGAPLYIADGILGIRGINAVADHKADPTGAVDSTAALSAAWAALKAQRNANDTNPTALVIPPGTYLVDSSVNWAGMASTYLAWNTFIIAEGAIFVGRGTGKNVIDMTGTRGVHVRGLCVVGDTINIPACAVLVGARNTDTCGNNKFDNCKFKGYYSKASFVNVGCETTQYLFTYFINENPASNAFAYIGDGFNRFGMTSDYTSLRAANTAISFTNNRFAGCRFHKNVAGYAVYLEGTVGWQTDRDCYFLAFDDATVMIRQSSSFRNTNLRLEGLFETTQGAGVKYAVLLVTDDGDSTTINGFELSVGSPHARTATIRLARSSDLADMTTGNFRLDNAVIRQSGNAFGTVPMFSGARLSVNGEIWCDNAAYLNLAALLEFNGIVHTSDMSLGTMPGGNSKGLVIERTGGNVLLFGIKNYASEAAAQSGGTKVNGVWRNGTALQVRVT